MSGRDDVRRILGGPPSSGRGRVLCHGQQHGAANSQTVVAWGRPEEVPPQAS
jgi:hypothetical protein